ncbi:PhzF family phenazine biosynthesis protein [Saccharopolyspora sp. 7B]|uniref:PhzF family phenazine biosynthesis protein n=1 Tax=Saccharopolyspora sp. 7B TaxID=2877240 RepID=UPI001CD706A4|nr:PhzF family phenazine biosynthesis protein [Saccharopolyspora sp. 7B]MCA1280078.1 PhzF family phenazine biosynthesis protein [Saccharopolyspora sp. 7B]
MRTYVVDSFTEHPFSGNPAGVVLLDAPAAEPWMQSVAAEMRHAETAFVVLDGTEPKPLRWFTPTTEVDLCGHATLAAAHALGGDQRFATRSGELICTDAGDGWIGMDFPASAADPVEPPSDLAAALPGATVEDVRAAPGRLLVRVSAAAEVRGLEPDLARIATWPYRGVVVTAAGDRDGVDFVSRFFAPASGIPEDPVTGSAHCQLAPYWAAELGRSGVELVGEQASPRGGFVRATPLGDRVALRGRAVTVLDGELRV